jgi:choline dehydrogenase-like flavoprotein
LTAGAVDSPRLLLLSGIGPKHDLENLNVPVARDIPGVGKSLTDHPDVFFTYHMKPGFSNRHSFTSNPDKVQAATDQWLRDETGPFQEHYGSIPVAFFKAENTYETEEFARLPEQTQNLLKKSTVPNFEFALVRDALSDAIYA